MPEYDITALIEAATDTNFRFEDHRELIEGVLKGLLAQNRRTSWTCLAQALQGPLNYSPARQALSSWCSSNFPKLVSELRERRLLPS